MFYIYIYIIAWLIMSTQSRLAEKLYFNKTVGPVHTPYAYKHKNFEVVIPKRVDGNAEHMTYAMRHYHDSPPEDEDGSEARYSRDDNVHLRIPIGAQDHHVELRPSRHIMSPGMLIETFKHARRSHGHYPGTKRKTRQCHFTGHIRGRRRSRAALSTCNGLSGYIHTGDELFMIEPKYTRDHSVDEPHPHILYRQPTQAGEVLFAAKIKDSNCDDISPTARKKKRDVHIVEHIPEMYIEALVVLDHSFLRYHKDIDIENYVLSIFNIAHNLFHDATLGVNINLAIVRLIRLEVEDHEMNLAMNHNINKTMHHFQLWQKRINPSEDTHPNHHDLAVLLTRIDICSDDKTCGFLGAARFAGMCDPENGTVIVQDSGLLVGYTLAHEIGHTLSMTHDLPEPAKYIDEFAPMESLSIVANSTVMSQHITDNIIEWSNCSTFRLENFIDNGFGSCLIDEPTEHSFATSDQLPGVMYDGDFQCKTFFGPNSALCMTGIECDNLICFVEDKGCIETYTRPAEGTLCGQNQWCFHGECVEIGERPGAVHGGWSEWTEWSHCTRTCGSGVASQRRFCNKPSPMYGGKYCNGDHVRYKICETEPCAPDQPSFRDLQCSEFNAWVYPGDGKVHQWKSYPIHDENPCALYCVSETGNVASLRPRVIDGTTCYREIRDICINGLCKEIPCDLDLQSSSVEDSCGVCKGDGTSCDVVRGEVFVECVETLSDQKQVLVIPEGAVNVKVEEMVPSETRIQVRDQDGVNIYIDGDVLGMYNLHGWTAWLGMIRTKQEAISIQGPLSETITIWAVIAGNSTLRYSYGMAAKAKRSPDFSWDYLDWTACSAECGPGLAESVAKCVERSAGLVDETFCKKLEPRPPTLRRPCEIAPCIPRWFVGEWGRCQHCPFGTRTRIVRCYKPVGNGEGELEFVADSVCANNKPKSSETCHCNQRDKRDDTPTATEAPVSPNDLNINLIENCTDSTTETYDPTSTTPATPTMNKTTIRIQSVVDFMFVKNMKIVVHTELEKNKNFPSGLPHPKHDNSTRYEYTGKDVLKFMNSLQHDFSNNKTKI